MRVTMLPAILLLAQCAPTGSGPEDRPPAAAASEGQGARECIDFGAVTSRGAEDERTIRFDLIGGAVYRNRLPGACPGLRQASRGFGALAFDVQSGRLCRGDLVRVVDRGRAGGALPCVLGHFVPEEAEVEAPSRQP